MAGKDEFDPLLKKIGKLNKKIRFIAIIHKNGKILKSEMRDEVPSLLKTKNEETVSYTHLTLPTICSV